MKFLPSRALSGERENVFIFLLLGSRRGTPYIKKGKQGEVVVEGKRRGRWKEDGVFFGPWDFYMGFGIRNEDLRAVLAEKHCFK